MEDELDRLYAENVEIKKRCEHYRLQYLRLKEEAAQRQLVVDTLKEDLKTEREAVTLARKERNEFLVAHNKRLDEVREAERRAAMLAQVNMIMVRQLKHLDQLRTALEEELRVPNRRLEQDEGFPDK